MRRALERGTGQKVPEKWRARLVEELARELAPAAKDGDPLWPVSHPMTLESRITALATLLADRDTAHTDVRAAEDDLRAAIIDAVRPVLPALCQPLGDGSARELRDRRGLRGNGWVLTDDGDAHPVQPTPGDLATTLSIAIDRQLAGNLPARVDELRAEAAILRGLAGALRGLKDARAAKKKR